MGKFHWTKQAYAVLLLCAATAISLPAQTLTTLFSFDDANGENPYGGLVQGEDGNLYGTTYQGGSGTSCRAYGCGTIFKISPAGALTTLHNFVGYPVEGSNPAAGLLLDNNGSLYGTTEYGGTGNFLGGTVFAVTPGGTVTTLYSFCAHAPCVNGTVPLAGLVLGMDGNFYGTTEDGGTNTGTIFKMTPAGTLNVIHNFEGPAYPESGLVQGSDGNFYGTTYWGGAHAFGQVFKVTSSGTFTTLYSFCPSQSNCTDGAYPQAGLIQGTDGNLYGTTSQGGVSGGSCKGYGCGTVFKITTSGTLTTLYSFCSQSDCADGEYPVAALVQASDGNFYGTTAFGGSDSACAKGEGCGTVFEITAEGALTTLASFNVTNGQHPRAGLVQDTDGNFYGTTDLGGANSKGTVFSLSTGLGPFVETLPSYGTVGATVGILGTNLTGATGVTFNGVPATFTVNSTGTAIRTTVPAGATSGTVQVVTRGGTLSSNVPFQVE